MFFNDWLDILLYKKKPEQIVAGNPTIGSAFTNYLIALVISTIFTGIALFMTIPQLEAILVLTGMDATTYVVTGILFTAIAGGLIFSVIGVFIGALVLHLLAKIVGGKGNLGVTVASLIMLDAAYTGTIGVLSGIITILVALVPALAMLLSIGMLVVLIAGLYFLVLTVLAINAAHSLSTGRAVIAVIVIPIGIGLVLAMIVGVLIGYYLM